MANPDYTAQDVPTWAANLDSMNSLKAVGNIKNPLLHLPLLNSLAFAKGVGSLTFARSTTGTYIDRYDVRQITAIDAPRFEKEGLLIEGASTNEALHSADLTNGAHVKTSCTALKDATGRDGVGSSASTLTATAPSATCLQTVTKASAENTYAVAIKRKTGTGTVEITMDGGATWTDITSNLSTTAWYNPDLTQTLANPEFGIRLTTSGDEVEVDETQLEELPFASSYIPTTGASVTRTTESLLLTYIGNSSAEVFADETVLADIEIPGSKNMHGWSTEGMAFFRVFFVAPNWLGQWGNDPNPQVAAGTSAVGQMDRIGIVRELDGTVTSWLNGVKGGSDVSDGTMSGTPTDIRIGATSGGASPLYGHLTNFRIYDRALSDREMAVA